MAHEYGWNKDYILEHVYFDELLALVDVMRVRHADEYRMQLAITQNPHVKNPKTLWKMLEDNQPKKIDEQMDVRGMQNLKRKMAESKRFVAK